MITFQYPAYAPTVTLELSSPEKEDTAILEGQMRVILTRDNTQRTYVKKAETKILELEFIVTGTKRVEVVNFFRGLGSNYIRYIDYIPRLVPDTDPQEYTFDNWILNLIDDVEPISISRDKYEFTIIAERWSTTAL